MSNFIMHPFHLVDESPWPILSCMFSYGLVSGMVKWFYFSLNNLFMLSLFFMFMIMFQWWRDLTRESSLLGFHMNMVEIGLRIGMILFIISEVLFFVSFFWAFFHMSLSTSVEIGNKWPPMGVNPLNPMSVPLLNTIILLSSGISVTWAHNSFINYNLINTKYSMFITVMLGFYFSLIQILEYNESSFSISDSIYGSSFFMATGFHGIHVLIGTIFLFVCFYRMMIGEFSYNHYFGFEAAAWYWHFVDIIWLFLFMSIYWWGQIF